MARGRNGCTASIGQTDDIAPNTVYAVLRRAGLHRLAWLHRTTREIAMSMPAPARWFTWTSRNSVASRRVAASASCPASPRPTAVLSAASRLGFDFLHVAVDDDSRYANVEALPDERGATAAAFLVRALAHFGRQGITVERILTDNGACYVSRIFTDNGGGQEYTVEAHVAFPASDQRQGGGVQQDPAGRVGLPTTVLLQSRAARHAASVPCVLQSPASARRHRRGYSHLPPVNNVPGNYT